MDWVRSLPCCVSGAPATDCHHVKIPGLGGTSKTHDYFVIPLTREIHQDGHQSGWRSWEKKHQVSQCELLIRILDKAFREGVIEL